MLIPKLGTGCRIILFAHENGTISFDAVKQIALARIERRPPRLDLDAYPHLPRANVQTTRAASYAVLAGGLAASARQQPTQR